MDKYEFKPSKQYPPFAANALGEVKNLKTGNILKGCTASNGYRVIGKKIGKRSTNLLVHRIVADALIPNPQNLPVVNHKDGNKLNNNIDNLEWCTQSHNMKHAAENGMLNTENRLRGEDCNLTVYTEDKIREVCADLETGMKNIDVSSKHNIPSSYIKSIKNGYSWAHISKDYNIKLRDVCTDRLPDGCVKMVCELLLLKEQTINILRNVNKIYPQLKKHHIHDIRKGKTYKHISKLYGLSD